VAFAVDVDAVAAGAGGGLLCTGSETKSDESYRPTISLEFMVRV
jgi:hypothetical protein